MDKQTRKEIDGRTLRQRSYDKETGLLNEAARRLSKLFRQTHETVNGRRVKLSKRRKEAKGYAIIDRIFDGEINVEQDVRDQVRLFDDEG